MATALWIGVVLVSMWLERRLVVLSSSWLPRLSSGEGLQGDARDLGFSLLAATPPALPDIWAILFTLATLVVLSRRTPDPESPRNKMMGHLLFVFGMMWVMWSQLGFLSSLQGAASTALPPNHHSSLFARVCSLRLSFHAIYLTVLMLSWKRYTVDSPRDQNVVTGLWLVSLCSVISSRVDFSADVVRGAFFGHLIFTFHTHFHPMAPGSSNAHMADAAALRKARKTRRKMRRRHGEESPVSSMSDEDRVRRRPKPQVPEDLGLTAPAKAGGQQIAEGDGASVEYLRSAYLQLIRKTLLNVIYCDAPLYSVGTDWSLKPETAYSDRLRFSGMDVPSQALCKTGTKRLEYLQNCVEKALQEGVAGDLVEVGVWRGGSAVLFRAILEAYNIVDRKVVLCGSFRHGFHLPWTAKALLRLLRQFLPIAMVTRILLLFKSVFPATLGSVLAGEKTPDCVTQRLAGSADEQAGCLQNYLEFALQYPDVIERAAEGTRLEHVKRTLKRFGVLDSQCELVVGEVPDVVSNVSSSRVALLRLSSGLSPQSCLAALKTLYPRVSQGGFVVVDDYSSVPACSAAVEAFRELENIRSPLQMVDHQCMAWMKPLST